MKSLCSQMYQLAEESYQRRDLRKAEELVRLLLLLDGSPSKRAVNLESRIRLAVKKAVVKTAVKKAAPRGAAVNKAAKTSAPKRGVTGRVPEIQITAMKPTRQGAANLSRIVDGVGKRAFIKLLKPLRSSGNVLPGDVAKKLFVKGLSETRDRLQGLKLDGGSLQPPVTRRLRAGSDSTAKSTPNAPRKPMTRTCQKQGKAPVSVPQVTERDSVVQRTPHMEFSCDEPLMPETAFDITIFADQQQARAGEESSGIVINAPRKVRDFKVDVKLLTSAHFEIKREALRRGKSQDKNFGSQQIVIHRDTPESSRVRFSLKVVGAAEMPDTQPTITALFQYKGRPSGQVTRRPTITGVVVAASNRRGSSTVPTGTFADNTPPDAADALPSLRLQHDAVAADMTISIVELGQMDGCHFYMIADAPAFSERWEGEWTLRSKTEDIVSGAMKVFTSAKNASASAVARSAALRGAGIEMFKATPPGFQNFFWNIVDGGKPLARILIVSQEPYIPWEIMVPQRRREDLTLETREALGAEFAIGRWVTSKYLSPPQKIAISQTYIVAPEYSADRKLANAEAEANMIKKCFTPAEIISPALVANISAKLASGGATLLHFVCHGKSGFPQSIALEQDMEDLNCWQIGALDGFTKSFPKARTFVFLNACEVGRLTPALMGVGGFGNSFVEIGASGVVAPLWSVEDNIAHQVAECFYKAVKEKPSAPFAEILRGIRKKAYAGKAEDTWAAYCYYGDPLAHCV